MMAYPHSLMLFLIWVRQFWSVQFTYENRQTESIERKIYAIFTYEWRFLDKNIIWWKRDIKRKNFANVYWLIKPVSVFDDVYILLCFSNAFVRNCIIMIKHASFHLFLKRCWNIFVTSFILFSIFLLFIW